MTEFTASMARLRPRDSSAKYKAWHASHVFKSDQIGTGFSPSSLDFWGGSILHVKRDAIGESLTLQIDSIPYSTSDTRGAPHLSADSTRELLEAVKRQAEVKGRRTAEREIGALRKKLSVLEREVARLRRENPQPALVGNTIVHGLEVPAEQIELIAVIEDSRRLLELGDDWDGEGAIGYTEETWTRAAKTLINLVTSMAGGESVVEPDFEILPGSNGGIDIDVRLGNRELLISVPADSQKQARFYGDNGQGRDQIKATFDPSRFPSWVSCWLAG